MPDFHYVFHNHAGGCAGAGAPLAGVPNPVAIAWPQLINAQLRLGVYPVGWVADEIAWRVYSFVIGFQTLAVVGALPGLLPPLPVAQVAPVAGVAANLPPSPVAIGVDATEKGQIGYHIGTAVGGVLGTFMATNHVNRRWYAFHLTRAVANGGAFTLVGGAPDIVAFNIHPVTGNWFDFVVWENKGHCGNAGGFAAILPALTQAQCLQNCTAFPGGLPFGGGGGPWAVDAYIASMVDVVGGNFRVQLIDPPGKPRPPHNVGPRAMDGFLRGYYAPFMEAIGRNSTPRSYDGKQFETVLLPKQIRMGLDSSIVKAMRSRTPGALAAAASSTGSTNKTPHTVFVDPTGISVEVPRDWAPHSRS